MTESVGDRYELGDLLGRGGMAEVRRAVDRRLGRPVAVKQLRRDLASDPTFQARFRREAQSAAGLNHPTIVAVYDTGEETDPSSGVSIPYIVMELVEGQTLRDVLREGRKILPERALELTQGVLDAIGYSHKAGIIHRDIKPANVMLTANGSIKVMDFGIARAMADTSATMTQTAAVIGTAQYLSPEQARGETVDARSDLYSAGCLLYELLTGRPPFVGDSPVSVVYQHVRETPTPPSQLDSVISPDIDAITLKALAKDPADRYQSAQEMKADIARVLAGQQATAVVPRAPTPVRADPPLDVSTRVAPPAVEVEEEEEEELEPEPARKGRAGIAVLITLVVLALLGGGAYAVYRLTNQPDVLVTVPNVLNQVEDQARSQLDAAQLRVRVQRVNGNADTRGTVTGQDPVGGIETAGGSTVTITVNDGPKTAPVPDGLVGQDVDDAKKTLKKAGFTNVVATAATSEGVDTKKDEVLAVTPNEGTTAQVDDKVTVTYATGRSTVPNVQGLPEKVAKQTLKDAGFSKVEVSKQTTSSAADGSVTRQSPGPNSTASRGSTVRLVVATAPPAPTDSQSSASAGPTGSASPSSSTSPSGGQSSSSPRSSASPSPTSTSSTPN